MIWLLLAGPAALGVILVALGPRLSRGATSLGVTAALTAGALVLAGGTDRAASAPFLDGQPLDLGMDGLSYALALTVCLVSACVIAAVPRQVEERQVRLIGTLLLFLSAVLLTLTARSLLPLLIGWELMGAASYVLIAHDLRSTRAAGSASTALLVTRSLDLGLYLAAGAALAGAGSLSLAGLPQLTGWPLHAAALGIVAACVGKAAQLPVSFWLSRAMDGPSPVSALLHSAAMVAMGGYLLLRTAPLLAASGWADDIVAWTGAVTAVALGLIALSQTDVKQVLAASTASQLGFVLLAAGAGAVAPGAAHLVAHASVKALLFLAAGTWLHVLGTRELSSLRGALMRLPAIGVLAGIGLLSLAGLPPLALWGSKDAVLAAVEERSVPLYLVALVGSALSTAYAVRVLRLLLTGPSREAPEPLPRTAVLPLVPLALGAAGLAVLALPGVGDRFAEVVGGELHTPVVGLVVSTVLSLSVAAFVWWRGDLLAARLPSLLRDWLRLEPTVHRLAVRPVLRLAELCAWFDDRVVDGAVRGAARVGRGSAAALGHFDDRAVDGAVRASTGGTLAVAAASARVDDRQVDGAVTAFADAIHRLGRAARRPQTGQLHDYYGQAALLLALATVLLLTLTVTR